MCSRTIWNFVTKPRSVSHSRAAPPNDATQRLSSGRPSDCTHRHVPLRLDRASPAQRVPQRTRGYSTGTLALQPGKGNGRGMGSRWGRAHREPQLLQRGQLLQAAGGDALDERVAVGVRIAVGGERHDVPQHDVRAEHGPHGLGQQVPRARDEDPADGV